LQYNYHMHDLLSYPLNHELEQYRRAIEKQLKTYKNRTYHGLTDNLDILIQTLCQIVIEIPGAYAFESHQSCIWESFLPHKLTSVNLFYPEDHLHNIIYVHTGPWFEAFMVATSTFCDKQKIENYNLVHSKPTEAPKS